MDESGQKNLPVSKIRKIEENVKSKSQRIQSEQANVSLDESSHDILQSKRQTLEKPKNIKRYPLKSEQQQDQANISEDNNDQDIVQAVEKMSGDVQNINSLHEDILMEIFENLNFKERRRIRRVCKKWYNLIRNQVSWQSIAMNVSRRAYLYDPIEIGSLLSCVTYMDLNCQYMSKGCIDYREISVTLQQVCPNLKTLIFHYVEFNGYSIRDLCCQVPENVRVLVLHHCKINYTEYIKHNNISKIEILDLNHCEGMYIDSYSFPKMPNLKRLHLAGCDTVRDDIFGGSLNPVVDNLEVLDLGYTWVHLMTFQIILGFAFPLIELYLCHTMVDDHILILNICQPVVKKLKVLCLRNCNVTVEGLDYLLNWCQSLQHVYVGSSKNINRPKHDYSKITSEKVHVISGSWSCNHRNEIDCMCV